MSQIKNKSKSKVQDKRLIVTGIQPYFEKVSAERGNPEQSSDSKISGFKLFGLFTADIINHNSVFVR